MRTLWLPEEVFARERVAYRDLNKTPGDPAHIRTMVMEPTRVLWPDGSVAAIYDVMSPALFDTAFVSTLRTVAPSSSGRRNGGMPTMHRAFGGQPRWPKRHVYFACRSNLDRKEPAIASGLVGRAQPLAQWYRSEIPERYEKQMAFTNTVHRYYRMADLPWTGGVINFDAKPYHRDQANVKDSFNVMLWLRSRSATGGHLVIPGWRMGFVAGHGHVLLHDAQRTLHGVTHMTGSGWRISVAYYTQAGLAPDRALPPDEERAQAQERT